MRRRVTLGAPVCLMENDDRRESLWSFVEMHSWSSRRTRPGCKHATRFDFDFDSECQEHAAKTAGVSIGGVVDRRLGQ